MARISLNCAGLLLSALLFALPFSPANAENWGTPYDKLFEEAGDRVKLTRARDGTEIREVLTEGGVQVRQERKDGKVNTATLDMADGPVLCFWEIAVTVRAALDVCEETKRPELAARLDTSIGKLNRFIVANALQKTKLDQMQAGIDARIKRFRQSQSAPETGRVSCAKPGQNTLRFINSYLADMAKKSNEDYQSGIEKFLSVPRLPAMNPCL